MATSARQLTNTSDSALSRRAVDLCAITTVCAIRERPAWNALEAELKHALLSYSCELHIELESDCLRLRHLLPGGFDEKRLGLNHPLNDAILVLQQQLWPLFDRRSSKSAWFVFPIDTDKYLFRLDLVSSSSGSSLVLRRLHSTSRPLHSLDELLACSDEIRSMRKLIRSSSGLIALAGDSMVGRLSLCRAIAQSLVSPDKKIVMAEEEYHPSVPRTTQIMLPSHPNAEQLASWQLGCEMSASSIITAFTHSASNTLAGKACEDCLVIQGVQATSAAGALKRLIAAGIRPEILASSLFAIASAYQIGHICELCKVPRKLSNTECNWISQYSPMREGAIKHWLAERLTDSFFEAPGCEACSSTGIGKMKFHLQITHISQAVQDALFSGDIRRAVQLITEADTLPQLLLKQAQQGKIPLAESIRISNAAMDRTAIQQ